jgi:hypothetical protein
MPALLASPPFTSSDWRSSGGSLSQLLWVIVYVFV